MVGNEHAMSLQVGRGRSPLNACPTAYRRARAVLAAAMVAALILAAWAPQAPAATNNFGTRSMDVERYGSRVSINTPSSLYYQAPDEFVLHRAVVQSSFTSSQPGLLQTGVYRSGNSIQLDNCGATNGGYYRYIESKAHGSSTFQCQVFYSAGALSPGTNLSYEVFRRSTNATWGVMINGVDRGSYALAFNVGFPAIGGEIADAGSDFATRTAAQYGPSGTLQWSYYTGVNRGGATAVNSGTATALYSPRGAFWTVPPPPTPMTIKHRE